MSRNLVLRWNPSKFTRDLNLMFAFEPPKDALLGKLENMVVWKVLKIKADAKVQDLSYATVSYQAKYGFGASVPNEDNKDNRVKVTDLLPIGLGETTQLELTKWGNPLFGKPTKAPPEESELFQATNCTGCKQWISIGLIDDNEEYSPTFNWLVGNTMTVQAGLYPVKILMGFVDLRNKYKESQFITTDITSKAMWAQNLPDLPTNTVWEVVENPSGDYSINRVE